MPSDLLHNLVSNLMEKARTPPSPMDTPDDEWEEHIVLRTMVEQIRGMQADSGCSLKHTGKTDFESLLSWLAQCGATVNKVNVDEFEGFGNGLQAIDDIEAGETIMAIPDFCMLTVDTAHRHAIGEFLQQDKLLSLMPNVVLALYVLIEMHDEDSFYEPYISTLPSTYSMPLYWELNELDALRGSPEFVEALRLYKHISRQYCYLFTKFSEPGLEDALGFDVGEFTFDDYRWAVATVMSRQNKIPVRDETEQGGVRWTLCLAPLWDLMNHKAGPVSSQFNLEAQALEHKAFEKVSIGDQVFMSYGARNNAEYILHQGFFYTDHPTDFMAIPFSVDEADPLAKIKTLLLSNLGVSLPADFTISMDPQLDPQLLAYARVCAMTKDVIADHLRNPQKCAMLGAPEGIVSPENEAASKKIVLKKLNTLLAGYPEDKVEDGQEQAQPCGHIAMARKLVESEKMFLKHSIALLS